MQGYKKGQYLSFDIIIAALIFSISFFMVFQYIQFMKSVVMDENRYMLADAELIANAIISPKGTNKIASMNSGVLDIQKIKKTNENEIEEMAKGNKVYIEVWGSNDNVKVKIGNKPDFDKVKNVARVTRIAACNDTNKEVDICTVGISVYKESQQ